VTDGSDLRRIELNSGGQRGTGEQAIDQQT